MSAIVRSWLRLHCETCREQREFRVEEGWVLVCLTCGARRELAGKGLAATA